MHFLPEINNQMEKLTKEEIIKKLDLTLENLTSSENEHIAVAKWAVLNGRDFLSKEYTADLVEEYSQQKQQRIDELEKDLKRAIESLKGFMEMSDCKYYTELTLNALTSII